MSQTAPRDVAVVLSGGGINGVLLELGFLKRLRETELWPRVGWIYGTSAGALSGTMAALDRLDELEEFLLVLQPEEVFRPRRVWQLPGGLHDYTLPETIANRLGDERELGEALAEAEIELVVFATDLTSHPDEGETRHYELSYASRSTPPETMGRAILASAAISALVLPVTVDGVIATDGGWVRNFPLDHAYRNPGVDAIAAFRYIASYRPTDLAFLERYPPSGVDAYLDTVVAEYGYISETPDGTFRPFAAVQVRLASPRGQVLFQDSLVSNAFRPFGTVQVAGPTSPSFATPLLFPLDPDRAAEGVDAALGAMARQVVARLR